MESDASSSCLAVVRPAVNVFPIQVEFYEQFSCVVPEPPPPPQETSCPAYSTSNTDSDSANYATCLIYSCPGSELVANGCNDACVGDQVS